jgi:hypothetical protein
MMNVVAKRILVGAKRKEQKEMEARTPDLPVAVDRTAHTSILLSWRER